MRTSFTKTLANYTSQESLITAVYNKKYHLRDFSLFIIIPGMFWQNLTKIGQIYKTL